MSWKSWFTGIDEEEEQRNQDDLDRQLAELNRRELERGTWNQATYDQAQANLDRSHINVEAEIDQAFDEGLQEGYDNVTGTIKSTLAAPFNFAFASIPWQLLLVGGLVLFWYMGGAVLIKGSLKKFK